MAHRHFSLRWQVHYLLENQACMIFSGFPNSLCVVLKLIIFREYSTAIAK
jgi:predicted secreted Zn-dependent protease